MNATAASEPADPGEFVVQRTDSGREVLLELAGELDAAGMDRFEEAASNIPPNALVTIDLAELRFMDSSGIRVLMNLDLRSRSEQWTLTLRSPRRQVLHVLQLCDFENRFQITQ